MYGVGEKNERGRYSGSPHATKEAVDEVARREKEKHEAKLKREGQELMDMKG